MKNSTIFPFERNNYFYGKLLSVNDFELEQKYVNDKRRMINRFICGTGVIAGLYVVMVDEQTISVETGCAFDSFGREIVVDMPVIKKLSLIDGFESFYDMQDNYVYLCIEYSEEAVNPVHSIAGNAAGAMLQEPQNNRIKEGYRLYLTGQRPADRNLSYDALYEERVCIYTGAGVTITQICPKYVQTGQDLELVIEIENLGPQYLSFSYDLQLTCLTYAGESRMTISFDEMLFEKTGKYTLTYRLQVMNVSGTEASAAVDPDSFGLYLAKERAEAAARGRSVMQVTDQDVKMELISRYHSQAMESRMMSGHQEAIYLARVYLVKAEGAYFIDRVETMPFHQYVMNNDLNAALITMLIREAGGPETGRFGSETELSERVGKTLKPQISDGLLEFDLSQGGQRGQRFLSKEIFHGLGLGRVAVMAGLEEEKQQVIYGSAAVFKDQTERAEVAVRLFEDKGSFIVGIRLLETVLEGKIRVRWTAVKSAGEEKTETTGKKILIKPGILELGLRDGHYLEANCLNMTDRRVEWSVREHGGHIDANGYYTAPNTPGVYEVTAQSVANPEIRASIFVIVRAGN